MRPPPALPVITNKQYRPGSGPLVLYTHADGSGIEVVEIRVVEDECLDKGRTYIIWIPSKAVERSVPQMKLDADVRGTRLGGFVNADSRDDLPIVPSGEAASIPMSFSGEKATFSSARSLYLFMLIFTATLFVQFSTGSIPALNIPIKSGSSDESRITSKNNLNLSHLRSSRNQQVGGGRGGEDKVTQNGDPHTPVTGGAKRRMVDRETPNGTPYSTDEISTPASDETPANKKNSGERGTHWVSAVYEIKRRENTVLLAARGRRSVGVSLGDHLDEEHDNNDEIEGSSSDGSSTQFFTSTRIQTAKITHGK
jgi:hypothetical protein